MPIQVFTGQPRWLVSDAHGLQLYRSKHSPIGLCRNRIREPGGIREVPAQALLKSAMMGGAFSI